MLRDLPSPFNLNDNDTGPFMTLPLGLPNPPYAPTPGSEHVDPLSDVFGSAPSSPTLHPTTSNPTTNSHPSTHPDFNIRSGIVSQHPSEIPRLRRMHVTNGYRDGLAESKESFLQEGFDEGYALGAELGLSAGWLLGALEGMVRAVPSGKDGGRDDGKDSTGGEVGDRDRLKEMLRKAEEELRIEKLCGSAWFGEDGVWIYEVPVKNAGEGGGEDVTFAEVAEAHPVLKKWRGEVRELARWVGLKLP